MIHEVMEKELGYIDEHGRGSPKGPSRFELVAR
jgi:hypothetical protein